MPLAIADFKVGQSAAGSVADTIRALAPLVTAAWMAGICEAGVAAVPLVSLPVSPRVLSAASTPPEFTLSAVVKYGFPRFFGITKTFRPVFSPPDAAAPDEDEEGEELVELPEELHAASVADATRSTTGPHRALFERPLMPESFQ